MVTTVADVIGTFEIHPQSPFNTRCKPSTRNTYLGFMNRIVRDVGTVEIALPDIGLQFLAWHAGWSSEGRTANGSMFIAVLKAALSFAVVCGTPDAAAARTALAMSRFERPKARTAFATAEQVTALRRAAHERGAPERALCYALQFETALRLWDVIGQWAVDDIPARIVSGSKQWCGLMWPDIDAAGVLNYSPSKTDDSTGVTILSDLALCPMVGEETGGVLPRAGAVIIDPRTGLPYRQREFNYQFNLDRKAAGLPKALWARDLRASAVTEARAAGTATDDTSKVAGHSKRISAAVYDRAHLEAQRRMQTARITFREAA